MVGHGSIFSQILEAFSRRDFELLVRDIGTERRSKGFSSWDHFVSLLFCQLAQATSLREISLGMAASLGKLNHLGIKQAPKRSTLAYANEHRSCDLFEEMFRRLHKVLQADIGSKHRLKLPGKLYSLDATIISLCLSLFDWSRYRSAKGAVKLTMALDHDGYLPCFAAITVARKHDVTVARHMSFPAGSVVAVDRGYWSVDLFGQWLRDRVFFVTRAKVKIAFHVLSSQPVTGAVLADELVEFANDETRKRYPYVMRRIRYCDPETKKEYTFVTNLLDASAQVIADVYKERWQIELFFKALKQNLKVKTFIGTSFNAVMSQIWTALIAMLLVRYLQLKANRTWTFSTLVALLRWNLFTYRGLWDWLENPISVLPQGPPTEQLSLGF